MNDIETLQAGKPVIRGILAFLLHLRFAPMQEIKESYRQADIFIKELEEDMKYKQKQS